MNQRLSRYLTIVTIAGVVNIAVVAGSLVVRRPTFDGWAEFAVLSLLLVLSEQWPLVMQVRHDLDTITLSGIFACALLLRWNLAFVIAVQVIAYLAEDLRAGGRPWRKSAFNVAQYALALTAADLVIFVLRPEGASKPLGSADLIAALAGAAVFFVVNDILAGSALALSQGRSVSRSLVGELGFQASVNGTMVALAPLVLAAADQTLFLVPLLLLPMLAVYRGASLSIEREHRLSHDALTGLPNRTLFADRVSAAIDDARRAGTSVAVGVLDIDGFKDVNDTLGHAAGDLLLKMIGPRLAGGSTEAALARLGGDEFGILLTGADPVVEGRQLAARLDEPFVVDGFTFDLRASVGFAVFPGHGDSFDDLVRHADVAMYSAKSRRTGVELYDDRADPHNRRRLVLLNDLRPAMAEGHLELSYQPKLSVSTGGLVGLEALVRWNHPTLGLVMPDEFIGLAENSGLIRPMTEHLLGQLLTQQRQWHDAGLAVPVSLNVSARSLLDDAFPRAVADGLAEHDVPATLLVLELTETALMADPNRALSALLALSDMGIELSVDDFGTGYSSLAYLKMLPVGEVKIDKSFVTHVATDPSDRVIVQSTIDLAANLGMKTVAEGVETIEAWQTLAELGCAVAQGYLVGRPEPVDTTTALLHRGRSGPLISPVLFDRAKVSQET